MHSILSYYYVNIVHHFANTQTSKEKGKFSKLKARCIIISDVRSILGECSNPPAITGIEEDHITPDFDRMSSERFSCLPLAASR